MFFKICLTVISISYIIILATVLHYTIDECFLCFLTTTTPLLYSRVYRRLHVLITDDLKMSRLGD